MDLLMCIPSYLCQDLTVGSKHTISIDTVLLFNKYWKSWLGYGQGLCKRSLIEHGFTYPVKLVIYTTVKLTMAFASMFMNAVIRSDVTTSVIWIWVCDQREAEDDTYLSPTPFIYKWTHNRPI